MKNTIYSIALVIITLFVCLNPVRAQVTLVENLGSFDQPDTVFSFGNKNYYVLGTTGTTEQLWISDGTAFGTSFLATFENPGKFHSIPGSSDLFFIEYSAAGQMQLWKTNGTVAGTTMIISFGTYTKSAVWPEANGKMTYISYGNSGSGKLWASDGTVAGTIFILNFDFVLKPFKLPSSSDMYFLQGTASDIVSLWKSDGTVAGTTLVETLGTSTICDNLAVRDTVCYFSIKAATGSTFLYVSDGTNSGTNLEGISPEIFNFHFYQASNDLYFFERTAQGIVNLRKLELATGTTPLIGNFGSQLFIEQMVEVGNIYYYTPTSPSGTSLYVSDGTAAGTVFLTNGYTLYNVVKTGGSTDTWFFKKDNTGVMELWKTNGLPSGTSIVKQLGSYGNLITSTITDNKFYFILAAPGNSYHLWVTNGTVNGTTNLHTYNSSYYFHHFTGFPEAFFYELSASGNLELWKSSGTVAGTILIKNLGTLDNIDEMFFYNNKYYIIFSTTGTNEELWTSDGTNAGTTLLQSFLEPSYMHSFPSLNDLYFFNAANAQNFELWKTAAPLNVSEIQGDVNQLLVYPNPVNDNVTIQIDNNFSGVYSGIVTNTFGQTVQNFSFQKNEVSSSMQLDIAHLTPGVYTLTLTSTERTLARKILKR
ncbi:MAG: T9SS type A sorting domain-containing protein [Bacteroidetes bacterium]|nr:T9SS type A sorting domain-containing protein [Bacteroidota bacterium]